MSVRVAVTGIGLVTALGIGSELTWRNMLEGRSAVDRIQGFNAGSLASQLGAEIPAFRAEDYMTKARNLRMMTRADQYAFAASTLAVRDAGWEPDRLDPERVAIYLGGNKEISSPEHVADAVEAARNPDGTTDIRRFGTAAQETTYPLFYIAGLPGGAVFFVSEAYGFLGPNTYFAGTAESGATAVGTAFRTIRRGEADQALAGGFDAPVNWWNLSKLDTLGVLSERNDLGAAACRPFDRDRSGSVLGDGAAVLALEDMERAVRRGARIYAEVTGFGGGFDNAAVITPSPEGPDVAIAVRAALRDAGSDAAEPDYVCCHGSATIAGDASEARGIRAALGRAGDGPACGAVKAATGHLVAAAGALNVAVAALALEAGCVPPTLNLVHRDPMCDLDVVGPEARESRPRTALAVARGVEGQCTVIALRRT